LLLERAPKRKRPDDTGENWRFQPGFAPGAHIYGGAKWERAQRSQAGGEGAGSPVLRVNRPEAKHLQGAGVTSDTLPTGKGIESQERQRVNGLPSTLRLAPPSLAAAWRTASCLLMGGNGNGPLIFPLPPSESGQKMGVSISDPPPKKAKKRVPGSTPHQDV